MSGRVSLSLEVAQIERQRYERLSGCARKRLNPYRFWNDPHRAWRCPKSKPTFQPADRVVLQSRTVRRPGLLSSLNSELPATAQKDRALIEEQPLPLAARQITHQRRQTINQTFNHSSGRIEREPTSLEESFRQTVIERLSKQLVPPVSDHVRLDMIQLAHEWGIHIYRASTITEQIIHDVSTRKPFPPQPQSLQQEAAKGENQPLPAMETRNHNSLLIVMITLVSLIDLAILCYIL